MKSFKAAILISLLFPLTKISYTQSSIGGGLSAYTPGFAIGLDARANFEVTEKVEVTPNLNFYFKGSALILNADAHYLFNSSDLTYYPLAGLSFYKHELGSSIQFNVGGGARKPISENLQLFGELKLALSSNTGFLTTGGILYNLSSGTNKEKTTTKLKSSKEANSRKKENTTNNSDADFNSSYCDNGLFIDILPGTSTTSGEGLKSMTGIGISGRFGSKWYLSSNDNYGIGFQIVWLRSGFYSQETRNTVETFPLNIGATSVWKLGNNLALESNLNFGLHVHHFILKGDDPDGIAEIAINPNIKIRNEKYAFGVDITNTIAPIGQEGFKTNIFIFSLNAGVKF